MISLWKRFQTLETLSENAFMIEQPLPRKRFHGQKPICKNAICKNWSAKISSAKSHLQKCGLQKIPTEKRICKKLICKFSSAKNPSANFKFNESLPIKSHVICSQSQNKKPICKDGSFLV
jgi:hypothetical protein